MYGKSKMYGVGMVKDRIIKELKRLEREFEVKICYAVEAGSRAWGTSSKDSDYDVRFIYVHKKDWYLSIDQKRDVIEQPINEQLDLSGWDLRKALQLFRKSNPSLLEWLHSNIVYSQAFSLLEKMKQLENQVFQPKASLFHYLKMAKTNYRVCLQTEPINSKCYLNVIRPILVCKWIEKQNRFPPNDIHSLLGNVIVEEEIKRVILTLIERKVNRGDNQKQLNISIIQNFIEEEIQYLEDYSKDIEAPKQEFTATLNELFRHVLVEAWKDNDQ
jgi:predicted nucleotidyltransferase